MSVSENDLEAIECWLDGELADEYVQPLRGRLAGEPELTAAMDRLRGDRELRNRLFASLEPNESEIERLISSVRREVRKQELWGQRVRTTRKFASLAASIVLVFMAGWISRDRLRVRSAGPDKVASIAPINMVRPQGAQLVNARFPDDGQLHFVPPSGGLTFVGSPSSTFATASKAPINPERQVFQVYSFDLSGRLIGVQQFDVSGDPRRLIEQMGNFKMELPPPTAPPSQPILVDTPAEGKR